MKDPIAETSPRVVSRIGGVLYLVIIAIGAFGEMFVRGRIVVSGDATMTAANLRTMESLWRFGIAGEFLLLICGLIFFGCFCLVIGYLIFRSGYFPKALGVLMQITGVSYLVHGFALILAPTFANRIFAIIFVPAFIGEFSLGLWLLVKGVNIEKWNKFVSEREPTP